MDLHRPKLDADETIRLLLEREKFRRLPVVAVVAYDTADSRQDIAEVGCEGYIFVIQ